MAIHEYFPAQGRGCALCCYGFERLHAASEAPLETCPACGAALRRALAAPAIVVGGAHRLNEAHLAKHGYTQYRRVEKGRYEKTVGEGPDVLAS